VPQARGLLQRSPGMRVTVNGYTSVQVNVDPFGQNIVGDAANEPSLAVDSTNANRIVIGWRQFDTVLNNFRQAGYAYTTDGGFSWTFPGPIDPGQFRSDPVLSADADGNFYYNSLRVDDDYYCDVFKSTDGGATWDDGAFAYGGDKQWQAIDTTDGIGRGNIYVSWNSAFSSCLGHFTRSVDNGQTFEPCRNIPGTPYWGTLAVGPDGELYACGSGFIVAKSTNAQDPNETPTWQVRTVDLDGTIVGWGPPNPVGLHGQAWIAVDHSDGPSRGNVYLLSSVARNSSPDPLDVMFTRSTNGGVSWSTPVRVNDDPSTLHHQWFGTLAVAPNGRLDAVWYDTRNGPQPYGSTLFYSYSDDAGQTWSENVAVSPAFLPGTGYPAQDKLGDYIDMVSDNQGAHVAYAATFNNEQDVYYVHIPRLLSLTLPDGLPETLVPGEPTDVLVRVRPGAETYVPGTATLHYRYDGGEFRTKPMVPLGGGDFLAELPAASCAADPEFYFSVAADQSGTVTLPPGAPAGGGLRLPVGTATTVFEDNFEWDRGWIVEAGADDGNWERGDPETTAIPDVNPVQPGNDHTEIGSLCYVTGAASEGNAGANDLDGGPTRLVSPTFDLAGGDAEVRYWRWFHTPASAPDTLAVEITNNGGVTWRTAESISVRSEWTEGRWRVSDIVAPTSQMQIRFSVDDSPNNSLTEALIDDFRLTARFCNVVIDCNENGVEDAEDIATGVSADCNQNGVPDSCDIASGTSEDVDGDGRPDECGPPICRGDCNCDGLINFQDIPYLKAALGDNLAAWETLYEQEHGGSLPPCEFANCNVNGAGGVNFQDVPALKAALGTSCP
jgi:hypothetical protein